MIFKNGIRNRATAARNLPAKLRRQRGVALFITLLLLSIVSLLGLAMMLSVNSDMLINGYYGNYRSSFYAADSGLSIVRQAMANSFSGSVSNTACAGWGSTGATGCTSSPLSITNPATVTSTLSSSYGASFNTMSPSSSWPGSFEMVNSPTCTNSINNGSTTLPTPTTALGPSGSSTANLIVSYSYAVPYTLCVTGRAQSLQQTMVKESGIMVFTITANSSPGGNTPVSFAAFGAFINNYSPCTGPLIPGTMTGPMFTNGAWQFETGGTYIFTDPVGQANAKADYYINGSCYQSATKSYSSHGQTIAPQFQQGLNLSQPTVSLPPNDFSQQWAVLDGVGTGEGSSAPSNVQMNAVLKNASQTSYPTSGTSSGVYMPYCTGGASCASPYTVNGGGIYVQGSANVVLSTGTDAHGNKTQIYSITQSGTTTTITTNITANTTTMVQGSNTVNLTGVPENLTTGTASPATMLYVDGNITGLKGTGQGVAAVQDGTQLTITAAGNVDITGDVIYAHEPVTTSNNQIPGQAVDTLISSNDYNQVLGIYTNTGNIQLSSPYGNKNLQVDGSLAAIGSSCSSSSCGFTVSGYINTFNNVGGQIQSNIFGANMSTENTYFDRRFTSRSGFAPPWFPSTTVPAADVTTATAPTSNAQMQRLSWVSYPQ